MQSHEDIAKPAPADSQDDLINWISQSQVDFALISASGRHPLTMDEALKGPNRDLWLKAYDYEIGQLEKLHTWVIEDLPKGETAIPYSEVLREKPGPNGTTEVF